MKNKRVVIVTTTTFTSYKLSNLHILFVEERGNRTPLSYNNIRFMCKKQHISRYHS